MTYLWVVGGFAGIFLLVRLVHRRVRPVPLVYIDIELQPDGHRGVSVSPDSVPWEVVSLTALCYLAKIRWLLNSEPPEVLEAYREIVGQAIDFWPKERGPLIEALPFAQAISASLGPNEWTVPGGEVFSVRGQPTPKGGIFVTNDLPRPGFAVNIAWHVVVLLDYLSRLLEAYSQRTRFKLAMTDLFERLFDQSVSTGLRELQGLYDAANQAWADWTPNE